MPKKQRPSDFEYCHALWREFYLAGNFGAYAEAWDRFVAAQPMEAAMISRVLAREGAIKRLRKEFEDSDRNEHDSESTNPAPTHLRQQLLKLYGFECPPLALSVDGGPDGRIAREKASFAQHRAHRDHLAEYHRRGYRYQAKQRDDIDAVRPFLSDEQWTQLSLTELLEQPANETDAGTAVPPPPL